MATKTVKQSPTDAARLARARACGAIGGIPSDLAMIRRMCESINGRCKLALTEGEAASPRISTGQTTVLTTIGVRALQLLADVKQWQRTADDLDREVNHKL